MKKIRGALSLTLAALIWGTAFVAQSLGMDHIGPFTFNSARNFIGCAVLLPVIFLLRRRKDPAKAPGAAPHYRKTLWVGGVICGTILAVAASLQQIGIQYTTVGKAGFLTALYIVIVPIAGLFFGKRVPAAVWVSVAIAAAGTYMLSIKGDFSIGTGDLFVILCALGFTAHILAVDHFSPQVSGVELSCVQFLTAGVLSGIAALFAEAPTLQNVWLSIGPLLYTGVLSSGVAYTLQVVGQKDTPPAVASLLMSLESVFAALSGWLILRQQMSGREAVGCVLVFAAVILAQLPLSAIRAKLCRKKAV